MEPKPFDIPALLEELRRELWGPEQHPTQCSCGANHTSNPQHHLSYCDLNKGE